MRISDWSSDVCSSDLVARRLKALCAGPPPAARLAEVMLLGRGVAYRVESPELTALRDELAEAFAGLLVPQDQGRPRFHITVQNKVEPAEAKALADELRRAFRPRPLAIAGQIGRAHV